MKVYIVYNFFRHEDCKVERVYSNKDLAYKFAEIENEKIPQAESRYHYYYVEEQEVIED